MRTSRAGDSVPTGLGIFFGAAGIGSPALGAAAGAAAGAAPQVLHALVPQVLQPPVAQVSHLSLWQSAFNLSKSFGPLPQVSQPHFGAGAHTGFGAGQGAGHGAGAHVLHVSFLHSAFKRSKSFGPLASQLEHVAGAAQVAQGAPVSPANQAVVTNRNAAFTRYTSNRCNGGSGRRRDLPGAS